MKRNASALLYLAAVTIMAASPPAGAMQIETPFFSEYVEGSSYNKAVEIFNGTDNAIDLGTSHYRIEIFSNGSTTSTSTIALSGILGAGSTFVVANSRADSALATAAALLTGSLSFNGDDALLLRNESTIVDVLGRIGEDPGSQWTSGGIGTRNETLRRKSSIHAGDMNGLDAFDPSSGWSAFGQDRFDGLGEHATTSGRARVPAPTSLALVVAGLLGLAAIGKDRARPDHVVVTEN